MNIVVIDGQGGGLGRMIIEAVKKRYADAHITAVGTNAVATATMLKGNADEAATGENPVVVAVRTADVIIGPIGIVIPDSLLGEVTEKMALAVARSNAVRILVPMNRCDNLVAGVDNRPVGSLVEDVVNKLELIGK